jgi:uroporphyrin-III C-methyltransferase
VMRKSGKTYLIGAGPGDVELLTLKAVRALGLADVVLLDDLVNRDVLRFCKAGVKVLDVGKRGGCRSTPQAFIERLMVRYARTGAIVARVKGGDPFVFGRGGEELLALARAGIEAEVIGGLTAGISVPAALGIPVTHRGLTDGVTLLTGHTRDGREPDWEALVRGGTTLVLYMAMGRLAAIAASLARAGLPGSTPAAAIQAGSLPDQRSVIATLDTLVDAVVDAGLGSPAVVVFGDVVSVARKARTEMRGDADLSAGIGRRRAA